MEKQVAKMCQDCMYFNPYKKVCTKSPCNDISGELWFCPDYPNVKIMFFAVLHEHGIDFNGWETEIKILNETAQNEGWYSDLKTVKKKIEKVISSVLNNTNN